MKRFSFIVTFFLIPLLTLAQEVQIKLTGVFNGIVTYEAQFYHPFASGPNPTIQWSVTDGIIQGQNVDPTMGAIWISIDWRGTAQALSITATDAKGMIQSGSYQFGGSDCSVTPGYQSPYYLQIPQQLQGPGWCPGINKTATKTFQWQEATQFNGTTYNWSNVTSGGTSNNYQPSGQTIQTKYYRQAITALGVTVYTDPATISIPIFTPGNIYTSNTTISYNTSPAITATYAGGDLCQPESLLYWWEQSTIPGVWVNIGTTPYYPSSAPPIKAKTKIRRGVIDCNGAIQYSNELEFDISISSPNAENMNYLRVNTILRSGIYSWEQSDGLPIGEKFQHTTYYDGQGRPIQTVNKEVTQLANGTWADMVKHIQYDQAGRNDKNYLDYPSTSSIGKFKSGAASEQETFMLSKFGESPGAPTFHKTILEQSPLGRPLTWKAAGTAWGGDPSNYIGLSEEYEFNRSEEGVRIWSIDAAPGSLPTSSGTYATGKLVKSVIRNENNKKVYSYYSQEGHLVLQKVQLENAADENGHNGWLCTYYVYDDKEQLRSSISPKAVTYLQGNLWTFSSIDVYKELCSYNDYDARSRLIITHTPGAGEIHMVYDNKDRLVLTQNQNQRDRTAKQWAFTLYDNQDREVVTGLFDNDANRVAMADHVKNLPAGTSTISIFTGSAENIQVEIPVAGNASNCNSCGNTVINSVTYYDNYNYPGVKSFNSNYSFAATTNPNVEIGVNTNRVNAFITGGKVRVIDQNADDNNTSNDIFLTSTIYYDEKGRPLQDLSDNIKSGVDYTTNQYDFSGELLSRNENHTFPGSAMSSYEVITKIDYDVVGRPTEISKKYGNNNYKKISAFAYDELSRLKEKKLSPDYNSGGGLESLTYDYNIHGWITGINKSYATASTALNQWDHYFGQYLGYDNRDNRFADKQYSGVLTGVLWKTQGDNMPRKYDYQYDNAKRFVAALFTQKEKPTDATWSNAKMDFTVSDIIYDENNNLKQMYQRGIIPGNNAPVFIDKLIYEYKQVSGGEWSNQLRRVFDQPDLTQANNGLLGDFKDETFGVNADDYTFDGNGSLVKDNNKKIRNGSLNGITYNFMDMPQKIILENKSEIDFIYDATGEKLGKKVTIPPGPGGTSKTTWYVGDFIYEESGASILLTTILHEEGRIRVFDPVSNPRIAVGGNFDLPGSRKGVFEFFIKDHLQTVRMLLSEETYNEVNDCSMETASSAYEERMFGQVDINGNPVLSTNEVIKSRRDKADVAPGWNANGSQKVSRLKQEDQRIGPNMILKVMAGDEVTAIADYYYTGTPDNSGSGNILNSILGSMLSSLSYTGQTGALHGVAGNITGNYSLNPGDLGNFLTTQNNNSGNGAPLAYLNILFFDENFNFIPLDNVTGLGSNSWQANTPGDGIHPLNAINIKVPKNGYAYVYLSNDSKTAVCFDNFSVTHVRGRIAEENTYYPYGLKIKGISARAYKKEGNKYGYQGEFSEEEEETGLNEFDLRMYDPQIGRWTASDPYNQFASPYVGMGANPVCFTDEDGGEIDPGGWGAIVGTAIGFAIPHIVDALNGKDKKIEDKFWWGFAASAFTSGIGYGVAEHFWGNGAPIFANIRGFYGGFFGDDEVTFRDARTVCGVQKLSIPTANWNLIGDETYGEEYEKWKVLYKWMASRSNSTFSFVTINGYRIPVWVIPVPLGPPEFNANDKKNYKIDRIQPPDQYYSDPGDPNTVRRGVIGGRVFQIRVFDANGNDLGLYPDQTGFNRSDIVTATPLIYNKDFAKLQRKNGNSKFLKRRLHSFKFGYVMKKRYIYRKVYKRFFGIKIRIRKECLNCN